MQYKERFEACKPAGSWCQRRNFTCAVFVARVAIGVLCTSCTGATPSSPGGAGGRGDDDGSVPGDNKGGSGAGDVFEPAAGRLRLLTTAQFANSLIDLLGGSQILELDPDEAQAGFASVGASALSVSPIGVERYDLAVRDAVSNVFADVPRRDRLLGCKPSAPADEACARSFLSSFARRAWRGRADKADVDRYVAAARKIAAEQSDFYRGVRFTAAAILLSPNFLYRRELGEEHKAGDKHASYSSTEMASRLSYLIWNTTPDDELLAAAQNDELTTSAQIAAQAKRLLGSPRARPGLVNFISELFALDHLGVVAKDASLFPQLTPGLRQTMRSELEMMFEDVALTKAADVFELFTTRNTFVNEALGQLYGLSTKGNALVPVTLAQDGARAGVLGTAAFLTMWGKQHETSPTLRGKFLRTRLLCEEIASPPPGASTVLPEPPPGKTFTRREQLSVHMSEPSCRGCHEMMDPLGLGLEAFDPIGRHRTMDHGLPIDPSGDLDGAAFADAKDLGLRLKESEKAEACFVRNFVRYATGLLETEGQEPALQSLTKAFHDDRRLGSLVLNLVSSDAFRLAAQGKE